MDVFAADLIRGSEWTAGQVLDRVDQFRQMMLATHAEAGLGPDQVYDKIRNADPSRRVFPSIQTP